MLQGALLQQGYSGDSPVSYALLKKWDVDFSRWTYEQKKEFSDWSNAQPEEAGFGAYEKAPMAGEGGFGPGGTKIRTMVQATGFTGAIETR